MKIKRLNPIESYVDRKKSCLILGPRGSGKSFFLREFLSTQKNVIKIDLLNSLDFRKYLSNPEQIFLEVKENLKENKILIVCIDEIQKIPNLFDECHRIIEEISGRVIFLLTGSSARKLKRDKANLLAARALLVPFTSLSYNEINFLEHEFKIIQYGLLPAVFVERDDDLIQAYLKTYVATYLKEEIVEEALTRKVEIFNLFLELAAQYNGQPLTYNKLAKQLGVDNRTLKTHYEILEDTMLIHTIPAWSQSVKRRLLSSSKHYFFDNGVLNSLRSELKTEIKESSLRFGFLFENVIINEVVKVNQRLGEEFKIFHYRTDKGQEVDLILQKNSFSKPIAVEIKSSKRPSLDDLKGILVFKEEFPEAQLYCVCRADRAYTLEGIIFIPYLEFLQKLESAKIV